MNRPTSVLALLKDEKILTLGDVHRVTGLNLPEICRVTGRSEEEIIKIFTMKRGVFWLNPASQKAKFLALGLIGEDEL